MAVNVIVVSGVVKSPALRYSPDGKPEFRWTMTQQDGPYALYLPCCAVGAEIIGKLFYNLNSATGAEWWSALKFDNEVGESVAEFSWGFRIKPGASRSGTLNGLQVRFLGPAPDGSEGIILKEVSPVLAGASVNTGVMRLGKQSEQAELQAIYRRFVNREQAELRQLYVRVMNKLPAWQRH